MIFILNGVAKSGKDTFANLVANQLIHTDIDSMHYSIIDVVKKTCSWLGINSEKKDDKYRNLLSDLKIALDNYNDFTFNDVQNFIENFDSPKTCLFIDMRSLDDIKKAQNLWGAKTILIRRDVSEEAIPENAGDKEVETIPIANFDIVIDNEGNIEDLEEIAKWFVSLFIEKTEYDKSLVGVKTSATIKTFKSCDGSDMNVANLTKHVSLFPHWKHCKNCEHCNIIEYEAKCDLNHKYINCNYSVSQEEREEKLLEKYKIAEGTPIKINSDHIEIDSGHIKIDGYTIEDYLETTLSHLILNKNFAQENDLLTAKYVDKCLEEKFQKWLLNETIAYHAKNMIERSEAAIKATNIY